MATPAPAVTASAPLDAAQLAIEHARASLFPFRLERWLALGFVAFLDQCGRTGGMGFNVPGPGGVGNGDARADVEAGLAWLAAHVLLVSFIAAVVLAFVVALTALVLWVNSRGVFMYADLVASGRADVARPWRAHAAHASSYFAWSFGLAAATMTAVLVLVVAIATVVLVLVRGRPPAVAGGIVVMIGLVLLLLIVALGAVLASVALRDFVAPLQMATGRSCGEAIRLFAALLRAHPGLFAVYVLLKLVFTMVIGIGALIVGCCTCCLGFLPVIAQTILQPAYYFERAWPLHVLRRLGHDVFAAVSTPPPVPSPPVPAPPIT